MADRTTEEVLRETIAATMACRVCPGDYGQCGECRTRMRDALALPSDTTTLRAEVERERTAKIHATTRQGHAEEVAAHAQRETEKLRAEVERLTRELAETRDRMMVVEHKKILATENHAVARAEKAEAELERLTAERDEARAMLGASVAASDAAAGADRLLGTWPGTESDAEIAAALSEPDSAVERLTAERDEARDRAEDGVRNTKEWRREAQKQHELAVAAIATVAERDREIGRLKEALTLAVDASCAPPAVPQTGDKT